MDLTTVTCVKETETENEHKWGEDQSSLTVWKDVKKTQQQRIKGCELCCACNEIIGNFAMKAELSCSFRYENYKYRTHVKRLRQEAVFFLG